MEYQTLDPDLNEIRLMTILPNGERSLVNCTFEHASLINPPEFCALSYCWGDPAVTREILINGKSCQITKNLESALRHLRAKGYSRLWVDAICINQEDKTEKSLQLLWMGSIYRRAKEVVAWVGEEDSTSVTVMNDVASLKQVMLFNPHLNIFDIVSYLSFLDRPYWRRVWIIQELALARQISIHCGGRQISWKQFMLALEYANSNPLFATNLALANVNNLKRFHRDASNIKPLRFLEALRRSSRAISTDPRDKIFALLELVYDRALYVPVPNYRQTVQDICISITLSAVSTRSCLDTIALLGSGCENTHGLPSWCPFWVNLTDTHALNSLEYLTFGFRRFQSPPEDISSSTFTFHPEFGMYRASVGALSSFRATQNGAIQVQGILIDHISSLLCHNVKIEGVKDPQYWWLGNTCPPLTNNPYGDAAGVIQAISRALTRHLPRRYSVDYENGISPYIEGLLAAIASNGSFTSTDSEQMCELSGEEIDQQLQRHSLSFAAWLRIIASAIAALNFGSNRFQATNHAISVSSIEFQEGQMEPPLSFEFILRAIKHVFQDGQLFMITSTRCIGWAHPRAQPGDQIFVVGGCTVPVILRSRDNGGYVLVGDAYVEGIMDGEAVADARARNDDWATLEIY